jgi:hypothetical protein
MRAAERASDDRLDLLHARSQAEPTCCVARAPFGGGDEIVCRIWRIRVCTVTSPHQQQRALDWIPSGRTDRTCGAWIGAASLRSRTGNVAHRLVAGEDIEAPKPRPLHECSP